MISLDEFIKQNPDYVGWGKMKYRTYAPKLLPLLLWCAINRRLMTYGDLAMNVRFPPSYRRGSALATAAGWLAGYMGNYCVANELPPLNTLVVNQGNFLPSSGATPYFERYGIMDYDKMDTEEKRQAMSDKLYPLIFQPGIWTELLKVNGIQPLKPAHSRPYRQDAQEEIAGIRMPDFPLQGGQGESEAHKSLKKYVVENCGKIENLRLLGCVKNNADMEHLLPSMDRPDIFFGNDDFNVACEIKSWRSDDDDLLRGIFQCVKYKAILNALDKLEGRPAVSECVLVMQRELPENLQRVANRLRVPLIRLSRKKVKN